uniref:Uncharacterized protein n=1 Tax=Knipowitschia caucasica TaxID=637954 RepID=A0AAV2K8S1_KNICA
MSKSPSVAAGGQGRSAVSRPLLQAAVALGMMVWDRTAGYTLALGQHKAAKDPEPDRALEAKLGPGASGLFCRTTIHDDVLQHEKGDLNKFKEVKERLLKLFSAKPDMPETHPDRCLTCAVVGNSGNLKGSHNGPRIDAHQFVIR